MSGAKKETPVIGWRIVSASVCGSSHERAGQVGQDSNYWTKLEQGILVAAIADGSGSARLGHLGAKLSSRISVETICKFYPFQLCSHSLKSLMVESVKASLSAIETEAKAHNARLEDFACTLIVFIASPGSLAIAQIGDGAVVIKENDGAIATLTSPSYGEYINETTFLTSRDAFDVMQINVCQKSITHIAAFSDGLQRLGLNMPQGSPHLPFFSPLFDFISNVIDTRKARAELEDFLRSPRVQERTDDDLTLLLAVLIK